MNPLSRYAPALLQISVALIGAFVILPPETFTNWSTGVPAGLSLLSLFLGSLITYQVAAGWLKVAIPVATGVIASVIQFVITNDYSTTAIGYLAIAVLTGLATKVGVEIRADHDGRHVAA